MISRLAIKLAVVVALICAPTWVVGQRIAPERVGMKWGRCLLVVDGQTRIDGGCYYQI